MKTPKIREHTLPNLMGDLMIVLSQHNIHPPQKSPSLITTLPHRTKTTSNRMGIIRTTTRCKMATWTTITITNNLKPLNRRMSQSPMNTIRRRSSTLLWREVTWLETFYLAISNLMTISRSIVISSSLLKLMKFMFTIMMAIFMDYKSSTEIHMDIRIRKPSRVDCIYPNATIRDSLVLPK